MTIRPYQDSDLEAVLQLWHDCQLTRPWNNPRKDINRKLSVQRDLFLVAIADHRLVASVMAGYDGHRGWINYLAVAPDQQGQGWGRLIMAEAEKQLKAMGCPKINLQIRKDNREARAFYEAIGFQEDQVLSFGKRLEADD